MTDYAKYDEHDPRHHTQRLKQIIAAHARVDVQKVSDPKAKALFETAAEVLLGLAQGL